MTFHRTIQHRGFYYLTITIFSLLFITACATNVPAQDAPTQPVLPEILNPSAIPEPDTAAPVKLLPSQTASPQAPTPTPKPTALPVLKALSNAGCCVQPFFSPDSQKVLFIDKPASGAPAAVWGIGLDGGAAELVYAQVGVFSAQMNYRAFLQNGITLVESTQNGQRWEISNGGRQVFFSPDETKIAWSAGNQTGAGGSEIWISAIDGSQARRAFTSQGGGFAGWLPDGRILASSVAQDGSVDQVLLIVSPANEDGAEPQITEVARGARLRSPSLSPDGRWLVYLVAFSVDKEKNGLWLVDTQTENSRKLEMFGAYRWRDAKRLLLAPLDLDQPAHRLYQLDVDSGEISALTDPALTPFKIAGGDWNISPDGEKMVFVSALDRNIWLLELP